MTAPVSGRQLTIVHGDYTATIASVGASLRSLQHRGRDLVVPFDADEVRPDYRGATLVPWPNRVGDGRYTFEGSPQQLALTEPDRGNALHGLAAWLDFATVEATPSRVRLQATIVAQQGYPHTVDVAVVYELSDRGLEWSVTGANVGTSVAPWGTGPHPYLVAGPGHVDDWVLQVPADRILRVDPERLLPLGVTPVDEGDGESLDFRTARTIASTFIDHAYTALTASADGLVHVTVRADGGDEAGGVETGGVEMTFGADCPWLQVHTADKPDGGRRGLAVEPMTCPPDAFTSGVDLVVLEPGRSHTASWTISAL